MRTVSQARLLGWSPPGSPELETPVRPAKVVPGSHELKPLGESLQASRMRGSTTSQAGARMPERQVEPLDERSVHGARVLGLNDSFLELGGLS